VSSPSEPRVRPRVLCVDDEPQVLAGLRDTLRRHYDVVTESSPQAALGLIAHEEPFAVVISDYFMPAMNGAELLRRARALAPGTVRLLMTGHASLEAAINAVNEGNIFRFLTKPCPPPTLVAAIEDAIEQSRLVTADRRLVERKLESMTGHLLRAERLATLGTMAGAVGHELKNMLATFSSAVDFIRERAAEGLPAEAEDLETLKHIRDHLNTHARSLLALAKGGRAGGGVGAESDLGAAIAKTVEMLRSAGVLGAVEVAVALPDEPVKVGVEVTEIEQIFVNLVKNAVDALHEARRRRPRVDVTVRRGADGAQAVVDVRDNGTGIAAAKQPLIFEPYFTTKPPTQGTGLGLFVVKQIIEKHRGTIALASEEDVGTMFTVTIPVLAG
jgi:signal transduction histidine kinase